MDRVLDAEEFHAQAVLNAIEGFIDEFDDRGEIATVREILQKDYKDLRSGIVGQKAELFTEKNLILPTLHALGYDPDEITAQPAELVPDERSRPDFRIEGVHKACVCIVEAKRFGNLSGSSDSENIAEKELQEYLSENALVKYKRDLNVKYLVGIAADGIRWSLYVKNLESGEQKGIEQYSLAETFETAAFARQFPNQVDEKWNIEHRWEIRDGFIPKLAAPKLTNRIDEAIND
ncbi:hypothetical protein U4E84_09295 [Halorubrum sp. AD140]|uniref:hypothetical protein n=1 Tax=Halorubrum sp. AD140 TaxID=3050073 RepID=UPI002ACC9A2E|nr:hypothetical protein [Halorubrum sp. AD140]MDZ5811538.1 hypothetical protein [Halorubrum sp. AD140]